MDEQLRSSTMSGWKAALFVGETLAVVLIPSTGSALGGRWLDHRLDVTPVMTLAGFGFALTLSTALLIRKARQYRAMI